MPSLGAVILGTELRKRGYSVELIEGGDIPGLSPFGVDALAAVLAEARGEVLALSIFHDSMPLIVACRRAYPDCLKGRRVIIGGPGPTGVEKDLLDLLPEVSDVVRGDGESALVGLLESPNIARRRPGVFSKDFAGEGSSPREDLNRLQRYDWEICAPSKSRTTIPISSMRGCPFDCSFCEVIASFGRRVSFRDPELVGGDARTASEVFGTRNLRMVDDTFNVSRAHMTAVCNELAKYSFSFSAYARLELLNDSDLELLKTAGCKRLFFGVDILDVDSKERVSKGYGARQVREKITFVSQHIAVSMSMMWGFPDESYETFENGALLAEELLESRENVWPQYSLLSPSVETPLYKRHFDKLSLDIDCPIFPLNRSIRDEIGRSNGGDAVLEVLQDLPRIGAAFYRYTSPSFESKLARITALRDKVRLRRGRELIRHLEGTNG